MVGLVMVPKTGSPRATNSAIAENHKRFLFQEKMVCGNEAMGPLMEEHNRGQ